MEKWENIRRLPLLQNQVQYMKGDVYNVLVMIKKKERAQYSNKFSTVPTLMLKLIMLAFFWQFWATSAGQINNIIPSEYTHYCKQVETFNT